MNRFIRASGVLLLIVSGMVFASEQDYRIAGIIASDNADWRAIIELPDGKQQLVSEGDYLGAEKKRVVVVKISKEGVILQFPDGERQMQLSDGETQAQQSQDEVIPQSVPVLSLDEANAESAEGGTGVNVSDFNRLLNKQLSLDQAASVSGLEIFNKLSESARLLSYSYIDDIDVGYTPIKSLNSGVDQFRKAITEGKALRIVVEGDSTHPHIYLMPAHKE